MSTQKRLISLVLTLLTTMGCKTRGGLADSSAMKAFAASDASNTAVVLVHGWGKTPRRPNFIWRIKIKPYTDLSKLRESFISAGFTNVNTIEYDDEMSVDEMAADVARQLQSVYEKSNNPNLKFDVIAHSLGHFVALKAILEHNVSANSQEKLSDRVRILVGLAGAARGQDEIKPCRIFPNQCGGAEVLTPYYVTPERGAQELIKLFTLNRDAINKLKKCSVFAQGDEIVNSPFNSGSFSGLGLDPNNIKDIEMQYAGSKFHFDVKDSPTIIKDMMDGCYSLI